MPKDREQSEKELTLGLKYIGIKSGLLAGIIWCTIGITWIILGLRYHFNYIFALVLLVIGVFILTKGAIHVLGKHLS